jgi:hypothetical protein
MDDSMLSRSTLAALCFTLLLGTQPADAAKRPVLAVFDIQAKGASHSAAVLTQLTDYLAVLMAERGYQVVPRKAIKKRLAAARKASHKLSVDQRSRLAIGKQVAANHLLSVKLLAFGKQCRLVGTIYNATRSVSVEAKRVASACGEDALLPAIEQLAKRFGGSQGQGAAAKPTPGKVSKGKPITSPRDRCLSGTSCAVGRYLATHPYVLGGRFKNGKYANSPRVIVGRCSSRNSRIWIGGRQVARFTGPHQTGSKLKALIKAGRCLGAGPLPSPFHRCLTRAVCAKARYLATHPYVLGGRFPNGKYANSPWVRVGRCWTRNAVVYVGHRAVARFTGPHQAGSKVKALIKAGRCGLR